MRISYCKSKLEPRNVKYSTLFGNVAGFTIEEGRISTDDSVLYKCIPDSHQIKQQIPCGTN